MDDSGDHLFVVTEIAGAAAPPERPERRERSLGSILGAEKVSKVSVPLLKKNMDAFFSHLRELLEAGGETMGSFELDTVEVSAQVTGSGEICILGSGVKAGVGGGIRFVLKRKPPPSA